MEIRIPLQKKQTEFERAVRDKKVVFYGGAKGGGKSHALRNIVLARRLMYPGTTAGIFRKTYPELERNIIRPLFMQHPDLRKFYSKKDKVLYLPNGSFIEFNYCNTEADLELYQGAEYHDLAIEEAGQWPEDWFQRLRGSNRSSIPGVKTRTLLTGNPGGLGHKWLKRLFVTRDFHERENFDDYYFIQALVYDNPALLTNDPGYLDNLKAEPNEALRKAYLEGDWDIFAGQYFGEWRKAVHVLDPEWKPEPWWKIFGAYDHGFRHPAVFGAFAVDGDGHVYLYRELAVAQHRPDQIAQAIHDLMGDDMKRLGPIHAGHDVFSRGRGGEPSIDDQFRKLPKHLRLNMVKANIDRVLGAQQVRNYLAWQNLPEWKEIINGEEVLRRMQGPRFSVHPSCVKTIECLPRMIHDDKKPEDVMKVDATDTDPWAGDDPYDMVRYGLMTRPGISFKPKKQAAYASAKWFKQKMKEAKQMEKALKGRASLRRY